MPYPNLSPQQQLEFFKDKQDTFLDNLEACNAEEFRQWSKLYDAISTIVDQLEKEKEKRKRKRKP